MHPAHKQANQPTSPHTNPPSHEPSNPPIHQPMHPTMQPTSPGPPTHPPDYQPTPSLLCSSPLDDLAVYHHVERNPRIHPRIHGSILHHRACNPGWKDCSCLHTSLSYAAHLKIAGQARRYNLSTYPPTHPLEHPPIHQPIHPTIHRSSNPPTHPPNPPHLAHQPAHLPINPHLHHSASHHFRPLLFPIMWRAIEESMKQSKAHP